MPPAPLCPNRSRVINAHEGIFISATSMHSRTTLALSALGRDIVHVPWDCAMHGLLTPAAGLPRQLGVELSCHTHLCWEIKHCSGPPLHPQGPVQGWGLSALCQGRGCQGVLLHCALGGDSHLDSREIYPPPPVGPSVSQCCLVSLICK